MALSTLDWSFVIGFFIISLGIGIWTAKWGNKDASDYFTAGGKMPWWLLGVSMVATTFSTDTPNLVTDIVRQNGVSGNWAWWAFLLTGMLTVFIYARLWKKSGVVTDVEFYELRYSGKIARFLRGFRAIYLGLLFNVMIMATVSLAAIKIGGVLLGLSPLQTVVIAGTVTVIYSSLGGLKGVLITDFVQFFLSIGGAIIAAVVSLQHPKVGGLSNLLKHENVVDKLDLFPSFSNPEIFITLLLIPLLVQWWSVWYPGAEPGGGGYIAQRMFAAKNEDHSIKAVLFFNAAHYALRPWPWIIVALCSLVVFPDLESFRTAFPNAGSIINHDMGYPAMLTFIPSGLLGLVVTSLIAAYMSTISTHLNWGASYIVNDFYKRFAKPDATQKEMLNVGRIITVLLMVLTMIFALLLDNALGAFQILLQIGAGTGLIFILRWFWWRINAASEMAAMIISFLVAIYFGVFHKMMGFEPLASWMELVIGVGITTVGWIIVTYTSQPTSMEVMISFINKVSPGGPGWTKIINKAKADGLQLSEPSGPWKVPIGILCMIAGTIGIYAFLMGTGLFIYGRYLNAIILMGVTIVSIMVLKRFWSRLS
ncbi:sodium:solute symporter family protein [Marinoscillum sp. 108]|uniref:sodium:solute symporter family protein n=1 Tax=Marinoscillum sp. 108 TaxID=2653151 RepID=UPI0012EFB916|nr:sodium:solute symporter family protein [Marinoscillum sp. 108]VXD14332.1 Na+:solute symporter [Marinoscillum sp. 108]